MNPRYWNVPVMVNTGTFLVILAINLICSLESSQKWNAKTVKHSTVMVPNATLIEHLHDFKYGTTVSQNLHYKTLADKFSCISNLRAPDRGSEMVYLVSYEINLGRGISTEHHKQFWARIQILMLCLTG